MAAASACGGLIRLLDRLGSPARSSPAERCAEEYPDAVKQIVKSGHDLGGHSYTQDHLLAYMSLEDQQATIRKSIDLLEFICGGKKVNGWGSPVVAFTPETAGFLAKAGLKWTCDVTYADLPIRIHTPHGIIAGVPTTDFSDNRVMRASPRDLYDAHKGTFDYLVENEPMGLLVLVIHCQFGGRPLITAVLQDVLRYIAAVSRRLVRPSRRAGALGARGRPRRAQLQSRFLRGCLGFAAPSRARVRLPLTPLVPAKAGTQSLSDFLIFEITVLHSRSARECAEGAVGVGFEIERNGLLERLAVLVGERSFDQRGHLRGAIRLTAQARQQRHQPAQGRLASRMRVTVALTNVRARATSTASA